MEYYHFVTEVRAILVFILDFQFELYLREYSSMYLKSRGGDIFFIRKLFYFEIFGMYWGDILYKKHSVERRGDGGTFRFPHGIAVRKPIEMTNCFHSDPRHLLYRCTI